MANDRIQILTLLLWFFILINGLFGAQPLVRDIRIEGAGQIAEQSLIRESGLVRNRPLPGFWPDSCLKRIRQVYFRRGFYQVTVDSFKMHYTRDSSGVKITVWLEEGKPVRIGDIFMEIKRPHFEYDLSSILSFRSNQRFDEGAMKRGIEEILFFLENHGYPLAVVKIERFEYDSDHNSLNILLSVDPGPAVFIERFDIQGNEVTKTSVIYREIRLKPGDLYRHETVMNMSEELQRLGFFQSVDPPVARFRENRAVVMIRVHEGNPNTFDGVVGYTPSNDPERSGYFTGQLHFLFRNLFGTGRFFEAFWDKKDRFSQAMRFGYEEPWIMGWPVNAGGYFTQEIRDTTYVDRGWRLRIRYFPWPTLSLAVEGGRREILPDSIGSRQYGLAQSNSWVGSVGLDYSTFDEPLNPARGVRYHTKGTFGRKKNQGPAFLDTIPGWHRPVNTRHIQADAELVLPLLKRQVLFLGLHGQEVKSGEATVPLSEQIRFGGATTLRGYAEDMFRGSLVAWLNLEYRYLIGRRSRVFVFIDAGTYQRRERDDGFIRGNKIGYGFGLRLETRLGVMGVDYGLGQGDSPMQGKVHVGLVNRF